MAHTYREQFLRSLIGLGLVASKRVRELHEIQRTQQLSSTQLDELDAAGRSINFIDRRIKEFASNGVFCASQDLRKLPWWPDPSRSATIVLKMMAHAAKARLDLSRFDPSRLNLSIIDFRKI